MKLKTLIIGGSNTVMQPGYLPSLLSTMARRGVELDIVADLAVGGTTSAFGLYQLKTREQELADCDLLLIEYALNDAFVYGDERRPFRHWARFYEGIIRFARERNPKLRIATLVFGSRNGSFLTSVPSIDAGITYISQWYGTICVDVSRLLMQKLGREVVGHPSFYSDQGHYARPVATTMVANLIADELELALAAPLRPAALPPAIDPEHFAGARALDGAWLAKRLGQPVVEYSNRRFSIAAVDLGRDRLRFEVEKGMLLALNYVCEPRIPPLDVRMGEDMHRAAMLKGGVRDGTYKFLVSMLSFEFLYGPTLLDMQQTRALVLSGGTVSAEHKLHVPRDSIRHETFPAEPVLPLAGILFTGNLKACAIERSAAPLTRPADQLAEISPELAASGS
ncbi:SGNH/GDSL hydrolase family protein [Ensifer aridi]|uniref:SGNH/GDSL hydrolase family protein n=1 Tax=Ensifer aridi TaxID=1708715 RepID=UPI001FCDA2A6|nr:SGNH/GDSL hydrolase family protein [Ensifer aridi]